MADARTRRGTPELKFGPTHVALPAIALYLALVGILLWLSLSRTAGTFVYAQDDAYIHLALARTLADHGVWGIRPTEFASASSSPLWTLILAGFWKLGAHAVWVPFALNVVTGCVLLRVATRHVGQGFSLAHTILVTCALVLVTPLPTLAFIGMEHTLQALLVVMFAWQASERLAGERHDWLWPSVMAALMVATRYESLFVVAVVGAILLWQGKPAAAVMLGVIAAAPVAVFGAYSVAQGGLALPNSVLMKSGPARFSSVGGGVSAVVSDWVSVLNLFSRPPQLAVTIAVIGALLLVPASRLESARKPVWLAVIFVGTSLLHAALVKIYWFYRYEAYLVAFGAVAFVGLIGWAEWPRGVPRRRYTPPHPATTPLLILLALPLAARCLSALAVAARATANVFQQQVQMGQFFEEAYAGRAIAVNDLGAVAWLSSSPVLDVIGLGSPRVADLRRRQAWDSDALGRLADEQSVEAIAVYENAIAPVLPPSWLKVGEWTIEDNVAVSDDTVAFLAPNPQAAERLRLALEAYSKRLPPGVSWTQTTARVPARIRR